MITGIIKRNGVKEPWQPEKLIRWGQWAARNLGKRVNWNAIVVDTVNELNGDVHSQTLQEKLIEVTMRGESDAHYRMAGRLRAPLEHKKIFGDRTPTFKENYDKLVTAGYMDQPRYSDDDFAFVEKLINHKLDQEYAEFRIDFILKKYAIQDRVNKIYYETPQFCYMRCALALAVDSAPERRRHDIAQWYKYFSLGKLNAPSPNLLNLGTPHRGFASCCIYTNNDTAKSIGIGLHIAYTMTYMAAGTGHFLRVRSMMDPVRGGVVKHQGKLPYLRATKSMVEANLQAGRGGADNSTWSAYDPEGEALLALQNPMTVEEKRIRGIDFTIAITKHLVRMAARREKFFRFNCFTAPDLFDAMFGDDPEHFEALYKKYEEDPLFVKDYFSAREIILLANNEAWETGRYYKTWIDTVNQNTPFYDQITSSNLCQEIMLPNKGYNEMMELYSEMGIARTVFITSDGVRILLPSTTAVKVANGKEVGMRGSASRTVYSADDLKPGAIITSISYKEDDGTALIDGKVIEDTSAVNFFVSNLTVAEVVMAEREPEVAMCNIGAVVLPAIESDEEYADVAYYGLLMVDRCIRMAHYELPHIGYTSKARLNAGIGLMGVATTMAREGLKYSERAGVTRLHEINETHYYHLMNASIKLGEEFGNAPWIHRTRYPEGWLAFDNAPEFVDTLHDAPMHRDWETVRNKLIANGGMRFSCVVAHMPGEASSKASGVPNSQYPVRDVTLVKTDDGIVSRWASPDSDILGAKYESAWDVPIPFQVHMYGVIQKFTDQAISADLWRRIPEGDTITSTEMMETTILQTKVGMKSSYYCNALTSKSKKLDDGSTVIESVLNTSTSTGAECGAGGCKM